MIVDTSAVARDCLEIAKHEMPDNPPEITSDTIAALGQTTATGSMLSGGLLIYGGDKQITASEKIKM